MRTEPLREWALTLRFELLRVLGAAGLLGVSLAAVALLLWRAVPAVQAHTRNLLGAAQQARSALVLRRVNERRMEGEGHALDTLPGLFPTFAQSSRDIAQILAQAHKSHLTLGSAQYQLATEPGARFIRYQVLLPVKDQYGTIRRFLAEVLNSMPHAALQEIHVERPSVDGSQLEARVRFELIYRAQAL